MKYRTIGILGGMGPESTADLYLKIIKIFQREYGAKYDKDFPPFFVYSLPVPDVVESLENEELLVSLLVKGVKKLESAGADFIVVACNTVQVYLPEMRQAVGIPILSIPKETVREIKNRNFRRVGLLATETTLKAGLFDKEGKPLGIRIIKPNKKQQKVITRAIMNILSGKKSKAGKEGLKKIISGLKAKRAEAVILGCTDLPLLIKQRDSKLELFDTTEVLAWAAVKECQQDKDSSQYKDEARK